MMKLKLRRDKPVFLVIVVGGALMQLQPNLAVWCAALLLPFVVGASLFVVRWWSATPPQLAVIAAAFSTVPAVHYAWVFNVDGNAGYGMGAAYFANTFFDHSPVKRYDAIVKSRFVSSYLGFLFKNYEVNVSPWGNHQRVDSITVEPDVLMALRVGDNVRIERSPGLLGIPWVRATAR